MSILEFQREQLHFYIDAIKDENLLQKFMDLVNSEISDLDIPKEQMEKILRGRQEIADGKGISSEEAKIRTAEWFKRKM